VLADGRRVLVYELHITNFGAPTLRLKRIEVFSGSEPQADFTGAALTKMLTLLGGGKDADTARLETGRRLIAFIWIAFDPAHPVPASLRHRLTFDLPDATAEPKESVIDDVIVQVLKNPPPRLASPFTGGEWLAGSGPSNMSDHRRTVTALEGKAHDSQRFAIDWVMVGKNGNTFHDSRERNENFWAYGQPVHAVADGEVTEAVDVYPDNTPGQLPPVTVENITGNHVIVRIAPETYVLFAHLRAKSMHVHKGERVHQGAVIAELGNSGNSTGAHLHMQLMDASSPLAAEGMPFVFDHFTFLGHGSDFDEDHHPSVPRHDEMPLDDMVIGFP
jgi:hypothetical protein